MYESNLDMPTFSDNSFDNIVYEDMKVEEIIYIMSELDLDFVYSFMYITVFVFGFSISLLVVIIFILGWEAKAK